MQFNSMYHRCQNSKGLYTKTNKRARWPWLQLTEPDKPWNQFHIHVCKEVQSLMDMAVLTKVGDGSNMMFWKDRWLNGKGIKDIAPAVYAMVPKRTRNMRKVKEAMLNIQWVNDFQGALTVSVLMEYNELYQVLDQVVLLPEIPDEHTWRLSPIGQFSTKSDYMAMYQGVILFELAERVWRTWAPSKYKFFIWLWSTIGAGLPTSWQRGGWTTLSNDHSMTSILKLLTTSWSHASSLGWYGLASFSRWACWN
jgi:hypothetical protein